jgi:hypothetical protein
MSETGEKAWKFENKTTSMKMECNDLKFLLFQLKNRDGLKISNELMSDLEATGVVERQLSDTEGRIHDVVISEDWWGEKPLQTTTV